MKICYETLKSQISDSMTKEIEKIPNCCGIVQCYLLSLLYGFDFDLSEFSFTKGKGMSYWQMKEYLEPKGILMIMPLEKASIRFADCQVLAENGISISISGTNTHSMGNGNRFHTSLCTFFEGIAYLMYSDIAEIRMDSVKNLNVAFFCKKENEAINRLVTFEKQENIAA